ncbi:hypothetical protein ACROYT_G029954 [Oculina patagonica]
MIVRHCHESLAHAGKEQTLAQTRKMFWILGGRGLAKSTIRNCVKCRRLNEMPMNQIMAPLPRERLEPYKPPFTFSGVDFFGPLMVKWGRGLAKRWGCIFTCLSTRAVFLELVPSLKTDDFIMALRQFISRRGPPKEIRSDGGTNFVGAERELNEAIDRWNHATKRSQVDPSSPSSTSHVRGLGVTSADYQKASEGSASDDPADLEALTPNHFLLQRKVSGLPPGIFVKEEHLGRKQWRKLSDNGERRASSGFKYLVPVAKGRAPRQKIPGPPGWGLGMGPITPSRKTKLITETGNLCTHNYQGASSAACCLTGDDSIILMDSSMRNAGESRKETCMRIRALTHPKKTVRVGCWIVRTMYSTGKTAQVCREMAKYKVEILGISECRWTGSGQVRTQTGENIIFAGRNDNQHQSGVAIMMSKEASRALESWNPVSDRIITARFNSKHIKTTIIQVYAPTNDADTDEKDGFYDLLQQVYDRTPRHDIMITMGDWNAKLGHQLEGENGVVGKHGLGSERSDNGERFIEFCAANNMAITTTMFPHKDIHKYTWTSPDGRTRNQIDHIAVNGIFKRSVQDVRAFRGADVGSDHNLVVGNIRLKTSGVVRKQGELTARKYELSKLKVPEIKQRFVLELKNRFSCLAGTESDETGEDDTQNAESVEEKWSNIKKAYSETAKSVLGHRQRKSKTWISATSWRKIDERKKLKKKIEETRSERIRDRRRIEYNDKNKEVKRSLRADKREWANALAREAE